jgi:thiamine-monophosphate kinase
LADLGHILQNSNVAAAIHLDEINCSASIKKRLPQPLAMKCLLAGGDDYELCFTAPRTARAKIEMLSCEERIQLTRIGRIVEGAGLVVLDAAGRAVKLEVKGYDHFHVEHSL